MYYFVTGFIFCPPRQCYELSKYLFLCILLVVYQIEKKGNGPFMSTLFLAFIFLFVD